MLQLIKRLGSVTTELQLDIPGILNKYFARSTWTIFTFLRFNAIFENSQRSCLTDINRHLLPGLAKCCVRVQEGLRSHLWTTGLVRRKLCSDYFKKYRWGQHVKIALLCKNVITPFQQRLWPPDWDIMITKRHQLRQKEGQY